MIVKQIIAVLLLANVSLSSQNPVRNLGKDDIGKKEFTIGGSKFILYSHGAAGCVIPKNWNEALRILDSDDKLGVNVQKKSSMTGLTLADFVEYPDNNDILLEAGKNDYCDIQVLVMDNA